MDWRRWTTLDALVAGVLYKLPIEFPYSEDRETVDADYEFEYIGTEAVGEAIEEGKVVKSSNYYGIPRIWKEKKKYKVFLAQYREVTEDKVFRDKDKAIEFFEDLCSKTFG